MQSSVGRIEQTRRRRPSLLWRAPGQLVPRLEKHADRDETQHDREHQGQRRIRHSVRRPKSERRTDHADCCDQAGRLVAQQSGAQSKHRADRRGERHCEQRGRARLDHRQVHPEDQQRNRKNGAACTGQREDDSHDEAKSAAHESGCHRSSDQVSASCAGCNCGAVEKSFKIRVKLWPMEVSVVDYAKTLLSGAFSNANMPTSIAPQKRTALP